MIWHTLQTGSMVQLEQLREVKIPKWEAGTMQVTLIWANGDKVNRTLTNVDAGRLAAALECSIARDGSGRPRLTTPFDEKAKEPKPPK